MATKIRNAEENKQCMYTLFYIHRGTHKHAFNTAVHTLVFRTLLMKLKCVSAQFEMAFLPHYLHIQGI